MTLLLQATKHGVNTGSSAQDVPAEESMVNSLMSDLRKHDALEARDERRHLDVDTDFGKAPRDRHTLADSLVKFSNRLSASDSMAGDSDDAAPTQARSPIPLGTDDANNAALELAQDDSPADQVKCLTSHLPPLQR
jgi:hypothetical protein